MQDLRTRDAAVTSGSAAQAAPQAGKSTLVDQVQRIAAASPAAAATPQIEWLPQPFTITHYTFALESDPIHASSPLVQAAGLKEKHRESFLYGDRGILMQGTGQASNGQYITIDWSKGGPAGRDTAFTYGIGGRNGHPVPWKTVASDPAVVPTHSRVLIEAYQDKGEMVANDTGGAITGNHLDLFIGGATIAEAFQLGTKTSRVAILTGAKVDPKGGDRTSTNGQDRATQGDPQAPAPLHLDPKEQVPVAIHITELFGQITTGSLAAARARAHELAAEHRTAHGLPADGKSATTEAYGRAYMVSADLTRAQTALAAKQPGPAATAARNAEVLARDLGAEGLAAGALVNRVVAAAQGYERAAGRTTGGTGGTGPAATVTSKPGSHQLVGSSLSALGDRLLPHDLDLDRVYPHHGDPNDAHEERAVEFDAQGRVADTTWPTSLAVPRVRIDGQASEVTTRSPRPILDLVHSVRATDFTIAERSDPDNAAKDIGQVVVAPFTMKVVDTDPGYGLLVLEMVTPTVIDLGNGKSAEVYERIAILHLHTLTVARGATVQPGQQIATQGNTKTQAVHNHIAATNRMRIDFINAQTRAFASR
jgi:3D (Asp-Asp-Asp) domain-containing protein